MAKTVFLSWQDDRPSLEGRNFLERCLEKAIGGLGDEATLTEAERDLVVDRDTKGVSGSPHIVETIFKKIDEAMVFVADLTFVGERANGRPTPNPNVLIEYGRAQLSVGQDRIIAVMNTAYGTPSESTLPFNLRHLRWPILYDLPADSTSERRQAEKDRLTRVLQGAIRACINSVPEPPPAQPKVFVSHQAGWKPGFFRPEGGAVGLSDGRVGPGKEVRVAGSHPVWLRLMPNIDPSRTWGLTALRQVATSSDNHLLPLLTGGGLSYVRGEDGFGVYVPLPSEEATCSVVYCLILPRFSGHPC